MSAKNENVSNYDNASERRGSNRTQNLVRTSGWFLRFKLMSNAVSLGSLLVFPCAIYGSKHMGIVFVVIYITLSIVLTKPVIMMETLMGQFAAMGVMDMMYMFCPFFTGIGLTQMITCAFIMSYYGAIVSYFLYYFVYIFYDTLPWNSCRPAWKNCYNETQNKLNNGSVYAVEGFFRYEILMEHVMLDKGLNLPNLELLIALLFCWTLVFVLMCLGLRRVEYVAIVVGSLIVLLLIAFFIIALGNNGSRDGMLLLFTFNAQHIYDIDVWYSAVTLSFFTMGVASGSISTMASYVSEPQEIGSISTWLVLSEIAVSIFATLTCYAWLGVFNKDKKVDADHVSGTAISMAMVAYPYAMLKSWAPQLFAFLWFILVPLIGAINITAYMIVITSQVLDYFITFQERIAIALGCFFGFLLGIVYATPEGFLILDIVDSFAEFLCLIIVVFLEIVVIQIYSLKHFAWDYEFMTGNRFNKFYFVVLRFLPLFLLILYFPVIRNVVRLAQKKTAEYVLGLCLFFAGLLPILVMMIYMSIRKRCSRRVFSNHRWLPYEEEEEYKAFKQELMEVVPNNPKWYKDLFEY